MASGRLVLIGLGLHDESSMSLQALEAARSCQTLFLESYTGLLAGLDRARLEALAGRPVALLSREDVESRAERVLAAAEAGDVGVLVQGDPLASTTHADLLLRAREAGLGTRVVHGTSIFSAIACTGLQLVRFGRPATVPFPRPHYLPTSPLEVVHENLARSCHTLLLLDIDAAGGRHMTAAEGLDTLLGMERRLAEQGRAPEGRLAIGGSTLAVALARAGSPEPVVRAGPVDDLRRADLGPLPHVLAIPAPLHPMEARFLEEFAGWKGGATGSCGR